MTAGPIALFRCCAVLSGDSRVHIGANWLNTRDALREYRNANTPDPIASRFSRKA